MTNQSETQHPILDTDTPPAHNLLSALGGAVTERDAVYTNRMLNESYDHTSERYKDLILALVNEIFLVVESEIGKIHGNLLDSLVAARNNEGQPVVFKYEYRSEKEEAPKYVSFHIAGLNNGESDFDILYESPIEIPGNGHVKFMVHIVLSNLRGEKVGDPKTSRNILTRQYSISAVYELAISDHTTSAIQLRLPDDPIDEDVGFSDSNPVGDTYGFPSISEINGAMVAKFMSLIFDKLDVQNPAGLLARRKISAEELDEVIKQLFDDDGLKKRVMQSEILPQAIIEAVGQEFLANIGTMLSEQTRKFEEIYRYL